jgi:hypothetical protein
MYLSIKKSPIIFFTAMGGWRGRDKRFRAFRSKELIMIAGMEHGAPSLSRVAANIRVQWAYGRNYLRPRDEVNLLNFTIAFPQRRRICEVPSYFAGNPNQDQPLPTGPRSCRLPNSCSGGRGLRKTVSLGFWPSAIFARARSHGRRGARSPEGRRDQVGSSKCAGTEIFFTKGVDFSSNQKTPSFPWPLGVEQCWVSFFLCYYFSSPRGLPPFLFRVMQSKLIL